MKRYCQYNCCAGTPFIYCGELGVLTYCPLRKARVCNVCEQSEKRETDV